MTSFLELNPRFARVARIVVLAQDGTDTETQRVLRSFESLISLTVVVSENLGIGRGYSVLMAKARELGAEWVLHLEDDWECRETFEPYVEEMVDLLCGPRAVGYVRLRAFRERVSSRNLVTRARIRYRGAAPNVWVSDDAHFTFNPHFAHLATVERLIPVRGEIECMRKYEWLGLATGQLMRDCFWHIGETREALRRE